MEAYFDYRNVDSLLIREPVMARVQLLRDLAVRIDGELDVLAGVSTRALPEAPDLAGVALLKKHEWDQKLLEVMTWHDTVMARHCRRPAFTECLSVALQPEVLRAAEVLFPEAYRALREAKGLGRDREHWWRQPYVTRADAVKGSQILTISRCMHSEDGGEDLSQIPAGLLLQYGGYDDESAKRYSLALNALCAATTVWRAWHAELGGWAAYLGKTRNT